MVTPSRLPSGCSCCCQGGTLTLNVCPISLAFYGRVKESHKICFTSFGWSKMKVMEEMDYNYCKTYKVFWQIILGLQKGRQWPFKVEKDCNGNALAAEAVLQMRVQCLCINSVEVVRLHALSSPGPWEFSINGIEVKLLPYDEDAVFEFWFSSNDWNENMTFRSFTVSQELEDWDCQVWYFERDEAFDFSEPLLLFTHLWYWTVG